MMSDLMGEIKRFLNVPFTCSLGVPAPIMAVVLDCTPLAMRAFAL